MPDRRPPEIHDVLEIVKERSDDRRARYRALGGVAAAGLGVAITVQSGVLVPTENSEGRPTTTDLNIESNTRLPAEVRNDATIQAAVVKANAQYSVETIDVFAAYWGIDRDTATVIIGLQLVTPEADQTELISATEEKAEHIDRFEASEWAADADQIAQVWGVEESVVAVVIGNKLDGTPTWLEENGDNPNFGDWLVADFHTRGAEYEDAQELAEIWGLDEPVGAKWVYATLHEGEPESSLPLPQQLGETNLRVESDKKLASSDYTSVDIDFKADEWGLPKDVTVILLAATVE